MDPARAKPARDRRGEGGDSLFPADLAERIHLELRVMGIGKVPSRSPSGISPGFSQLFDQPI